MAYEVDLGHELVKYLREKGCKVYQEVVVGSDSCDIVFVEKDGTVNCVEMKLKFNLKVIYQAARWSQEGVKVWVAVPKPNRWGDYEAQVAICKMLHIGILVVTITPNEWDTWSHIQAYKAPEHPKKLHIEWSKYLSDAHADDVEAGSNHGSRSTPFSRFVERLRAFRNDHMDLSLEKCIRAVNAELKHYSSDSSAVQSIKSYIKRGIILSLK